MDCRKPHGLRLRAEGNALCTRCHNAEVFNARYAYVYAIALNSAGKPKLALAIKKPSSFLIKFT